MVLWLELGFMVNISVFEYDVVMENTFVDMYDKCGDVSIGHELFKIIHK
jgi:hypothetical protein